jgi:putative transposase
VAAPALDDAYHRVVESLAQEPPPVTKSYQIVPPPGSSPPLDPKQFADLLANDSQLILPLLDLLENAQCAIDDLIDVMGRATIEAVLRMSAEAIAGPRQQGKKSDRDIVYHGTQQGRVPLKEREIIVDKPRLRRRNPQAGEPAEVEIPAYEAMRGNSRLAQRMLEILISGVSTRRYEPILPEMAGTVGVSKSQVSRETIEAGERLLDDLAGRDFSGLDLLAVWIDGIQLGPTT